MAFPSNSRALLPDARRAASLLLLAALGLISACTTVETPPEKKPLGTTFEAKAFEKLPPAPAGAWSEALSAFNLSCTRFSSAPWNELCTKAKLESPERAEAFFAENFTPWAVEVPGKGDERTDTGLMTGYYEPLLHGSRVRGKKNAYPIYGVPDDLLIIDLAELYPELKGKRLRGKLDGRRVIPYDQRGVIQERRDMEKWAIAWVDDPVDAFFLQVQGSGRIELPDGTFMRVGFADQNGWRYRSIGNWLIREEGLKPHELSMQRIRAWAKANPGKVKKALAQNPSFIFFEERSGDPALGPVGAQSVPLTPEASVTVDPSRWRLGTPFMIEAEQDRPQLHLARPVIAQDTGGAIRGVLRFDYFWGFGDKAGAAAGRQKSRVRAWVLVPKGLVPADILPGGAHAPR